MYKITFFIVALNAGKTLGPLLEDLEAQTMDHRLVEVLLIDSMSKDNTRSIMDAFAARSSYDVRVLENPKQWLAPGCNIALREYRGENIMRLDAHGRIPKDFLEKNLAALEKGEDIVGGSTLSLAPENAWQSMLKMLDASRFGGGAAPFRNAGTARYVDTIAYALYRRKVFDTVGYYDERLRRTEDNDMHYRMRKAGFRFAFCPEIVSWHTARPTFRGLLRQKWSNGLWIGKTLPIKPYCFALRHLIPAFFVLALILCLAFCLISPLPLIALGIAYLSMDLYFSIQATLRADSGKLLTLFTVPFLFPTLHLSYGTGTLLGLLTPIRKDSSDAPIR